MGDFAATLMGSQQRVQWSLMPVGSNVGRGRASLPPLRVGLWPIQSESMPEIALGMAVLLGFLLECWQAVRVYRLLASVSGEPG